jgi:hypothetical protein
MSSSDQRRRRGQPSRYLNGGQNALVRRPPHPGENLEQVGAWTREQLLQMDHRYVGAVEAAIRLGLENRASACACERPGAGHRDRLSMAS